MKSDRNNPARASTPRTVQANAKIGRRELLGTAATVTSVGAIGLLLTRPCYASVNEIEEPVDSLPPTPPMPFDPAVGGLLANIEHGDNPTRQSAAKQAYLVGTPAIGLLAEVCGGIDSGAAKAALEALQRIVHNAARPGAGGERLAAAQQLTKLIGGDQPHSVRADALKLLGCVGGPSEVTAIADLIHVPDIREDARMALERIPDPSADVALRNCSRTVPADYRAAIDQSLRHRKIKPKDAGIRK